jgi:molybdate transport system ATP-binding protein
MAEFHLAFRLEQGPFTLALDVSADAKAIVLFGPSGSGKTSALEAIAGLRRLHSGTIAVNGRTLFDSERGIDVAVRDRRLGYVPQDVLLFPHRDVRRNVTYADDGLRPERLQMLGELLELDSLLDRSVASLSGGERQRVALARALYAQPDALLLDEPLAAVDLPRRRRIVDALARVRDELGVPIVYVTHMPEEALLIADWAVRIVGGRVEAVGAPREVIAPFSL